MSIAKLSASKFFFILSHVVFLSFPVSLATGMHSNLIYPLYYRINKSPPHMFRPPKSKLSPLFYNSNIILNTISCLIFPPIQQHSCICYIEIILVLVFTTHLSQREINFGLNAFLHLIQNSTLFSTIGATPTLSLTNNTITDPILSSISLIQFSATLIHMCYIEFITTQHSIPSTTAITKLYPIPLKWGRLHGSNDVINVLSYNLFLSNSLIFLDSFSYNFSRSSYTSSDLTTLYLTYSPYYKIYMSSLYVPKPPEPSLYHLFYNR